MKNFDRADLSFSLCGLNCTLCTMKLDGYCPGCGGGAGNQGCSIARCSLEHGNLNYCFECAEYPCSKYYGINEFDSFITHRNQLSDIEKAKSIGIKQYLTELDEKVVILKYLLQNFNDGRRKSFFCISVNLLSLADVKLAMEKIEADSIYISDLKQKALIATNCFQSIATQYGITLKLNKKPSRLAKS